MKKLIYFTLWNVEKVENILEKYELNGLRLNTVKCFYVFDFVESKPKKANYMITYNMAQDRTEALFEYEQELLSKYSADKIKSFSSRFNFFRITGKNENLIHIKKYRNEYFKHVVLQHMLISLFGFLLGFFLVFATIFQNGDFVLLICGVIYSFIALCVFVFYFYGYIKQKAKCKK